MIDKAKLKQWLENTNKTIFPEGHDLITFSNLRDAAVAIILVAKNNRESTEYSVIFAKRSKSVPKHKGQIAFPGGGIEKNETLRETAIRETREEIGISIDLSSDEWEFLGEYPKNFITFSDYIITPFIFVYNSKNGNNLNYQPDGYEIVEVFEIPLKHLLDPVNKRIEKREWQGNQIDIHFFNYNGKTIWGITGWLLHDFLNSLAIIKKN